MNYGSNPVEDLASSLYHALAVGLPDIEYHAVDYGDKTVSEMKKTNIPIHQWPKCKKTRRPTVRDIGGLAMFQETWGSTALGFGGVGGASMSTANTVVISFGEWTAVYWGGRMGYLLRANGGSSQFWEDVTHHKTLSRKVAKDRYGDNVIIPNEE